MGITGSKRLAAFRPMGEYGAAEPKKAGDPVSFAYQFPLRILVAEDDYITRRMLVTFLKYSGYEATSVDNGRECLEEALRNTYDLIITDIEMPEMDGLECAQQLRERGVEIPIIALSGSSVADPWGECRRAGIDEFVPKPFPPDKLRRVLRDAYFGQLRKGRHM